MLKEVLWSQVQAEAILVGAGVCVQVLAVASSHGQGRLLGYVRLGGLQLRSTEAACYGRWERMLRQPSN